MKKLKKAMVLFGLALSIIVTTNSVAYAQGMRSISYANGIDPRWSYLESISISLSFNDLGRASCFTSMVAQRGDYYCKVESTLYQLDGGMWKPIKSWTDTGSGAAGISNAVYVKSGYLYRLRSKCSVYNVAGTTLLETHTEDYEKGN